MTWTNIIDKVDKEKLDWAKASTEHVTETHKKFINPKDFDKAMSELEKDEVYQRNLKKLQNDKKS